MTEHKHHGHDAEHDDPNAETLLKYSGTDDVGALAAALIAAAVSAGYPTSVVRAVTGGFIVPVLVRDTFLAKALQDVGEPGVGAPILAAASQNSIVAIRDAIVAAAVEATGALAGAVEARDTTLLRAADAETAATVAGVANTSAMAAALAADAAQVAAVEARDAVVVLRDEVQYLRDEVFLALQELGGGDGNNGGGNDPEPETATAPAKRRTRTAKATDA